MERNLTNYSDDSECPILCVSKSILFIVVAVFVLYLPLGDPQDHCVHLTTRNNNGAVCCLCDIHKFLVKAARKTADTVEIIVCGLLEVLYEAKLKFYALLEKVDKKDLCRSVCCTLDENEAEQSENKDKRRPCRCGRKMCGKRH